ncbi:hypothetical protein VPH35_086288 [Triticum aestivum]
MGKQQQKTLLRAARDGSLRLLKKICRYLVKDLRLNVKRHRVELRLRRLRSSSKHRSRARPLHGTTDDFIGWRHCGIVELLLSKGIDVDFECVFGTPLHAAALHKQDDVVKILLEHHADPNKFCKVGGYIPLSMAIRPTPSVSLECVKLLIKAGAAVNFIDSAGVACVMVAAEYGLPGIMKCLLDAGANPNVTSRFGATPIEVAALKDRREIVEMLFPLTSPIPTLPEWSIDGIISHVKSFGLEPLDEHQYEKKKSELKLQAMDAMDLDPCPDDHAILLANRSLYSLHLGDGEYALSDATMCRKLRPLWQKGSCEAFADGLKLDPTSVEIASALR